MFFLLFIFYFKKSLFSFNLIKPNNFSYPEDKFDRCFVLKYSIYNYSLSQMFQNIFNENKNLKKNYSNIFLNRIRN